MSYRIPQLRPAVAFIAAVLTLGVAPVLPIAASTPIRVSARQVTVAMDRGTTVHLPLVASHVAVHWSGNPEANLSIALSADGTNFSAPIAVETVDKRDDHQTETFSGVIWTGGARAVRIYADASIGHATVVAIDAHRPARSISTGPYVAAAAVAQPAVISRAGWGADESLRYDSAGNQLWPPEFHPVQKLIVHHTAGRNGDPDPASTVRAIYYYDAVTQGWGDMGYNS